MHPSLDVRTHEQLLLPDICMKYVPGVKLNFILNYDYAT